MERVGRVLPKAVNRHPVQFRTLRCRATVPLAKTAKGFKIVIVEKFVAPMWDDAHLRLAVEAACVPLGHGT